MLIAYKLAVSNSEDFSNSATKPSAVRIEVLNSSGTLHYGWQQFGMVLVDYVCHNVITSFHRNVFWTKITLYWDSLRQSW